MLLCNFWVGAHAGTPSHSILWIVLRWVICNAQALCQSCELRNLKLIFLLYLKRWLRIISRSVNVTLPNQDALTQPEVVHNSKYVSSYIQICGKAILCWLHDSLQRQRLLLVSSKSFIPDVVLRQRAFLCAFISVTVDYPSTCMRVSIDKTILAITRLSS